MTTYPMQTVWRFALVLLIGVGVVAIGAAGLELSGLVEDGTLFKGSGNAEKWVAVAVGLLLQPFGWTALRHARLSLDEHELRYLGFGFTCTSRKIALADIRRWGHAVTRNQRRRELMLLLERQDLSTRQIKVEMYERKQELLDHLAQRLGPPTPASATMTGIQFDESN